jgi:hypothetical protein
MEELANLITNLGKDLIKNKQEIIEHFDAKFNTIEKENQFLKDTIEKQQNRINLLEKTVRQNNIVMFGLPENENTIDDLEKTVLKIFYDDLKVDIQASDINFVKRIGKKTQNCRPALVSFIAWKKKTERLKEQRQP